jgi:hypothetical protein
MCTRISETIDTCNAKMWTHTSECNPYGSDSVEWPKINKKCTVWRQGLKTGLWVTVRENPCFCWYRRPENQDLSTSQQIGYNKRETNNIWCLLFLSNFHPKEIHVRRERIPRHMIGVSKHCSILQFYHTLYINKCWYYTLMCDRLSFRIIKLI